MIKFNELKVTDDGKYLVVDVQIAEDDYYENVYIDQIIIDSDKKFSDFGPVGEILNLDLSTEDVIDEETGIVTGTITVNKKSYKGIIDVDSIGDRLFFVYVITKGMPTAETPCSLKKANNIGVAYNKYLLYRLGMNYIKPVADRCNYDKRFIDFILQLKAFELSIATGKYNWAIVHWNKFFLGSPSGAPLKPCNCGT